MSKNLSNDIMSREMIEIAQQTKIITNGVQPVVRHVTDGLKKYKTDPA
jgi:hypothetical protein